MAKVNKVLENLHGQILLAVKGSKREALAALRCMMEVLKSWERTTN